MRDDLPIQRPQQLHWFDRSHRSRQRNSRESCRGLSCGFASGCQRVGTRCFSSSVQFRTVARYQWPAFPWPCRRVDYPNKAAVRQHVPRPCFAANSAPRHSRREQFGSTEPDAVRRGHDDRGELAARCGGDVYQFGGRRPYRRKSTPTLGACTMALPLGQLSITGGTRMSLSSRSPLTPPASGCICGQIHAKVNLPILRVSLQVGPRSRQRSGPPTSRRRGAADRVDAGDGRPARPHRTRGQHRLHGAARRRLTPPIPKTTLSEVWARPRSRRVGVSSRAFQRRVCMAR